MPQEELALTDPEATKLAELESQIEAGTMQVGRALVTIRDNRLYRAEHRSFEAYMKDRWGYGKSHGYRLISAVEVSSRNVKIGKKKDVKIGKKCPIMGDISYLSSHSESYPSSHKVSNERQARALGELPQDEQPDAWLEIQERAKEEGRPISAKLISEVVERRMADAAGEAGSDPAEPEVAGDDPGLPDEPVLSADELGNAITDLRIADVFLRSQELRDLMAAIATAKRSVKALEGDPLAAYLHLNHIEKDLANAWKGIKFGLPYALCPPGVTGEYTKIGWLPKEHYDRIAADRKSA
jgi:hypothetical protein